MTKQAAPLLRRWIERLRRQGVSFRPRHSLTSFSRTKSNEWEVMFTTPDGPDVLHAKALILALGGASWPETGSDGGWVQLLTKAGVTIAPLAPANCGYEVAWPDGFLGEAEGLPLKNVVVNFAGLSIAGELLITKYGLEGGALYQLNRELRRIAVPQITIDLKPSFTIAQLRDKLKIGMYGSDNPPSPLEEASKVWRLSRVAKNLLVSKARFSSVEELATLAKAYPITLRGPRPIEEAISSAGGVHWDELDDNLMLRRLPGVFCAGEMMDWDAPTGGYLIQGCFSTATRAARGALGI